MPNSFSYLNPYLADFIKQENKQREIVGNSPLSVIQAKYKDVTDKYKDLNFVQRAESPNNYPYLQQEGYIETHRMAYSNIDNNKAIVYPTIFQKENGSLEKFDNGNNAAKYALRSGNYIPFDNSSNAKEYSENGLINHTENRIPYADSNSEQGILGVISELSKKEQSSFYQSDLESFMNKLKNR